MAEHPAHSFHPLSVADVLETQVDPAAWEIAGHIVLKRQEDYDTVTQVCVRAVF